MLSNCSNSYVKNKKTITSPDDLMKFTNIWCEKQKQTNNVIKMCGQGWSKDLNISESKAIIDAKLKIADITQHSIIKSEKIVKKEKVEEGKSVRSDEVGAIKNDLILIPEDFKCKVKDLHILHDIMFLDS